HLAVGAGLDTAALASTSGPPRLFEAFNPLRTGSVLRPHAWERLKLHAKTCDLRRPCRSRTDRKRQSHTCNRPPSRDRERSSNAGPRHPHVLACLPRTQQPEGTTAKNQSIASASRTLRQDLAKCEPAPRRSERLWHQCWPARALATATAEDAGCSAGGCPMDKCQAPGRLCHRHAGR